MPDLQLVADDIGGEELVALTRDVGDVFAGEEELDARYDGGIDEESLGSKMGGATGDAAEEGILVLESFGKGG